MKTTANDQLRDQLKGVRAQINEARDEKASARAARDQAKEAFLATGLSVTDPAVKGRQEWKDAQAAVARAGKAEDRLDELQSSESSLLGMLGERVSSPRGADGLYGAPVPGSWAASGLLHDAQLELEEMSSSRMAVGRVNLGQVIDRDGLAQSLGGDLMAASEVTTGTDGVRRSTSLGAVPQLQRQLRVLDLIPTGVMDNNLLPYMQESGDLTTARETAEGAVKPAADVVFTDAEAKAATIAHWLKVRKQTLADVPALGSIIESRLRYGVELRLADEILSGDGVGENIKGIRNTTGIGSVPFTAGALIADQVLEGITVVFLSDAEANGVLLNPRDWKLALQAKAEGDGHYFSAGPFSVTPQVMWGVPLIPTKSIPQNKALVGDFARGAMLFIREGVNVLVSDSDGDDFKRNRVTVLAEMRAALAVFRPSAFTDVDLSA